MMNIFLKEHQLLLEKLLRAGVKFIIIGGYAVNYHGYNRTTGDLDLWIKPDNKNRDILITVLKEFDFQTEGLEKLHNTDFSKPFVFNFWEKPYKVDVLTKISGVSFDEAYKKKIIENFEGLSIPFLDFHHLILSKMTTNRLRDQADVEELQKIMKLKGRKPDR
jgi:predicted nucleotidyltransferase